MYNFSGLWYRVWAVCGIVLLSCVIMLMFEKPWKNGFRSELSKFELIGIAFSLIMGIITVSRIIMPNVSQYAGELVAEHRNSRVAPPLPFTMEYTFETSSGEKRSLYLDIFSLKKIVPQGFEIGQEYIIYFDEFTNVIVGAKPM